MSLTPTNTLDVPTIIRRTLAGKEVDTTVRLRFIGRFVDYCVRVTSGELYWR
jgi:hypothetical protein